ncbi:hypothetical protein E2C01_034906 [Portunus trituberculatus]|uniref:Uncharacterized protein n=1 Tax=Portunus trituberculatus TaxID=210409 RepID=A0A5B7F872_PORTR|nr:hypothetical protein [Portunus trituberculatus]
MQPGTESHGLHSEIRGVFINPLAAPDKRFILSFFFVQEANQPKTKID